MTTPARDTAHYDQMTAHIRDYASLVRLIYDQFLIEGFTSDEAVMFAAMYLEHLDSCDS